MNPFLDSVSVGMGVTFFCGSDSFAGTIHRIDFSGKTPKIWFSEDKHKPVDNFDFYTNQKYNYSNDNVDKPEEWTLCTLRKDNLWHVGTRMSGTVIHIGYRRYYQDPCF